MFWSRLLWTLGPALVAAWLFRFPYPSYDGLSAPVGRVVLDVWPVAAVWIVLLGAVIPPLGRAMAAREVLRQRAIGGLALLLALAQGVEAAELLADLVGRPAPGGTSVVAASVVGAAAITGIAARTIDVRGFGGGFLVLLAAAVLTGIDVESFARAISEDARLLTPYFVGAVGSLGLGWWGAAPEAPTAARPGVLGAGLVLAGSTLYLGALGEVVLLAVVLAAVFAAAFRLPGRIAADVARWAPDEASVAYQEARRSWIRAGVGAVLFTAAIGAAALALDEVSRPGTAATLLALAVVGAVARSLRDAARTPDDVAVGTLPRLGEVDPALAYLRRHGVHATVRGVGLRQLWPFAAHVPLELRVAPGDVERAEAALAAIGPPRPPWSPERDDAPPPGTPVAPARPDEGVWPGPRMG